MDEPSRLPPNLPASIRRLIVANRHQGFCYIEPMQTDYQSVLHSLAGRGWTTRRIAKRIGISESQVSRYRSGERKPGVDIYKGIMALGEKEDVDVTRNG